MHSRWGRICRGWTLVLDLDPKEARRRLAIRPKALGQFDRMEEEPTDFYERVRRGYHEVARLHPNRVKIVLAEGSIEAVAEAVWKEVAAVFTI